MLLLDRCARISHFTGCHIPDNPGSGHLMVLGGRDIVIRDGIMGPTSPHDSAPIFGTLVNSLVEGNVFRDSHYRGAFLYLNCVCDSPMVIRNTPS